MMTMMATTVTANNTPIIIPAIVPADNPSLFSSVKFGVAVTETVDMGVVVDVVVVVSITTDGTDKNNITINLVLFMLPVLPASNWSAINPAAINAPSDPAWFNISAARSPEIGFPLESLNNIKMTSTLECE